MGEHVLTGEEAATRRKHRDVVAKGAQHVDIHQDGTEQVRIPIADGGSYDIPWGCLVPKSLANVLVAGRCLSATREGHGHGAHHGSLHGHGAGRRDCRGARHPERAHSMCGSFR